MALAPGDYIIYIFVSIEFIIAAGLTGETNMETGVKSFGAKGDGRADDWAALQRAIVETQGALVFGPGTFRISKGLVVDLNKRGKTEILGRGARIIAHGAEPALHFIGTHAGTADPKDVSAEVWARESTPVIRGLEILAEHPEADGIRLELTWQPILSQVTVRDCRHGIHLVKRNRNVIISECHVYHNRGVGIFLDGVNLHQIIVNTNHISYNAQGGIKLSKAEVRNIQICGNDIEYNFAKTGAQDIAADVWFLADNRGIREATIVGNTIQALRTPGGANVRIEGLREAGNRKAGLLNITGNLITSQECNILILDSRGVAIQGNTFILGPKRNIRVVGSACVAIGPNTLDHNPDYDSNARTEGGVEIEGCTACTVSGLCLQNEHGGDVTGGVIEVRNSSMINVTGCILIEPARAGVVLAGTRDSRVSDCIIRSGRHAVAEDSSSQNNMIVNNRVSGPGISSEGTGTVLSGNVHKE